MFPLVIEFHYNVSNFLSKNDPIQNIACSIEELFIDNVSLIQDGSRIHIKEEFIQDGYPARALYHLKNRVREVCNKDEKAQYDEHPKQNTTKLKIRIAKEAFPFMRKLEQSLEQIIRGIVVDVLKHNVQVKHEHCNHTEDEHIIEYVFMK